MMQCLVDLVFNCFGADLHFHRNFFVAHAPFSAVFKNGAAPERQCVNFSGHKFQEAFVVQAVFKFKFNVNAVQ